MHASGVRWSRARHRVSTWRAKAIGAALVATAAAGVTVATLPAAEAGSAYIYVSMPTWLNNCPKGGSVKYLNVSTWGLGSGGSDNKADYGDDMVYISAATNDNVTVVAQGLCYKGRDTYWGPAVSQNIKPRRAGQTWWIGPAGVRSN